MKNNYMHYAGFSYSKSLTNFEAFGWNISLSANILFMKNVGQELSGTKPVYRMERREFCMEDVWEARPTDGSFPNPVTFLIL